MASILRPQALQQFKKLEIGSGPNPQPDYVHVDVSANFPQVDILCDVSTERIPVDSGIFEEVLANHVIEHIPWRNAPFVVKEWARVLKPGGRIFLRTPDLRFIVDRYLSGELTPEWPGDEAAMIEIYGDIGPAQWTTIKLFSGQDYPSNFHHVCYDLEMLSRLLGVCGFERVQRLVVTPVFSPGELQVEAYRCQS